MFNIYLMLQQQDFFFNMELLPSFLHTFKTI